MGEIQETLDVSAAETLHEPKQTVRCSSRSSSREVRIRVPFLPNSFGVSAQTSSGVVRGGPEERFHRVPPGFLRVSRGSARAVGWCEHKKEHRMLLGISPELISVVYFSREGPQKRQKGTGGPSHRFAFPKRFLWMCRFPMDVKNSRFGMGHSGSLAEVSRYRAPPLSPLWQRVGEGSYEALKLY